MDRLDEFVDNLQEKIFEDAKQAYGERGFQRWRNPRFRGRMENPDGHARVTGSCGDSMDIYLKFEDDRVKEATYVTDGCASSAISASFAAELAIGKDPDELAAVSAEDVLEKIGRLPEDDQHCAALAAETVQEALGDYMSKKRGGDS